MLSFICWVCSIAFLFVVDINIYQFTTSLWNRDAPEATGDEPDDADFDMPKIYEPVSNRQR